MMAMRKPTAITGIAQPTQSQPATSQSRTAMPENTSAEMTRPTMATARYLPETRFQWTPATSTRTFRSPPGAGWNTSAGSAGVVASGWNTAAGSAGGVGPRLETEGGVPGRPGPPLDNGTG